MTSKSTITLLGFSTRHFSDDPDFAGTKVVDVSADDFVDQLNCHVDGGAELVPSEVKGEEHVRYVILENFTNTKAGMAEITDENRHLLHEDWVARQPGEPSVPTKWFEGLEPPRAEYLGVVLYTREQLHEEGIDIEEDYGIVTINGIMTPEMEPMNPMTHWRNAVGTEVGGSGVSFNLERYERAVSFHKKYAVVKVS